MRSEPYLGLNPFSRDDSRIFFGRSREAADLVSLTVSNSFVLLYSESGAGKTSILNAGLAPILERDRGFEVLATARPGQTPVPTDGGANVYLAGLLSSWDDDAARSSSLVDALAKRPRATDPDGLATPRAIIIDQAEELFTRFPERRDEREGFLEQLVAAVEADSRLRIILAIREDHLAELDSRSWIMPDGLRARMRLEGLRQGAALEAVVRPLAATDRSFAPGVAERLVRELAGSDDGLVEPVQLQVVCERLWRALPANVNTITAEHVRRHGDVNQALSSLYEQAISDTANRTGTDVAGIRAWVEDTFITQLGTRNLAVSAHGMTQGMPDAIAVELEAGRLLQAEWRRGARWYELSHDRLIEAIRDSNRRNEQRRLREPGELERDSADGVFEGGLAHGLAIAGALVGAEEAGVRRWVNVAGTSGGAIVAALLVAGYGPRDLANLLKDTDYAQWADYGWGGKYLGGLRNALRGRGLVPGRAFVHWLSARLAESPLGRPDPVFGDLVRDDLPADLDIDARARAKYRLRVLATDVTEGRLLVLPDDLAGYDDHEGNPIDRDSFPVVRAVRMSMSIPFAFEPVMLYRNGRPHQIVDGSVMSSFPVFMFDSTASVRRWTVGVRLVGGSAPEAPAYRRIPRPFWPVPMAFALYAATTAAWDRKVEATAAVRTMSVLTGASSALNFSPTEAERDGLYEAGLHAARAYFATQQTYVNSFGRRASGPAERR